MLLLFYHYYYGISPFCMCSIIICFCISPKLSNSLPHDLHLKYLERSSSLCFRLSFMRNYHRSYCIYLVCISERGFVLLLELKKPIIVKTNNDYIRLAIGAQYSIRPLGVVCC